MVMQAMSVTTLLVMGSLNCVICSMEAALDKRSQGAFCTLYFLPRYEPLSLQG